jgi:site-specific recombinase XerC
VNRDVVVQTVTVQTVTVLNAIRSFERLALSGKSPATKQWYSARLSLLARALGETRPLADVLEVDLFQWREGLEVRLKAGTLAPDTLHGYIRATRRLFRWLQKRGILEVDLVQDLNLPALPRRGKKGISDKNANLILDEAKRWSVRDYAMLRFFASTSARRGGVAELRMSDLRLELPDPFCRQVTVFEKGGKERTVVMDAETFRALSAWVAVRPGRSEYVFVSEGGKRLTVNSISEVIDRYKKRLGIVGRCSPHQWRHRWFRKILLNRMPLTQAAQLGGHQNVQLTYQYYGQFAFDDLQSAYDRYFTP